MLKSLVATLAERSEYKPIKQQPKETEQREREDAGAAAGSNPTPPPQQRHGGYGTF